MHWICEGKSNKDIAVILGNSESTVKAHVRSILLKLQARNRAQAAAKFTKEETYMKGYEAGQAAAFKRAGEILDGGTLVLRTKFKQVPLEEVKVARTCSPSTSEG